MRRLNDDRGATVVIAAIVVVVLLGMAGLVVDVGALYQERRELQNGADAAVLAIAESCGIGRACGTAYANAAAAQYAGANAEDGFTTVADVNLDEAGKTVTVRTRTLTEDGSAKVEPFFARVLGFDGATVEATATAIWGNPRQLRSTIPLIISECEFPFEADLPTAPRTIYFHDGASIEPCNAIAGMDTDGDGKLSGGFGWLVSSGGCEVSLTSSSWVTDDPGASPTSGCDVDFLASLVGEEVPLPFFVDTDGLGSNGRYFIGGFGMFHITGYNFGGGFKQPSLKDAPCSGDERCISGYFTTGVIYDGEPGGTDHGIVLVKLIK